METQPLLRWPAVIHLTGLSRSTIYKLMSEGSFPSSLKLTQRTVAWSLGDIQQWIESRTPTRSIVHEATVVFAKFGDNVVRFFALPRKAGWS